MSEKDKEFEYNNCLNDCFQKLFNDMQQCQSAFPQDYSDERRICNESAKGKFDACIECCKTKLLGCCNDDKL